MSEHSNTPGAGEKLPKKQKKYIFEKVLFGVLLALLLTFFCRFVLVPKNFGISKAVYNFIAAPVNKISSNNNRINILIMGKSGAEHEGADLTDTLILISIPLYSGEIKTISIPRDIWVPDLMAKINSAYYWGKTGSTYFPVQETGGGISFAKRIVGKIIGQPVQYGIVVDFSAFKEIVDAIGGINVDVDHPFVDNYYPIAGKENDICGGDATFACRYETIIFDSGTQFMNGDTALKYVRSRHAEGDEGTDIAREARQQKVIEAIKNKMVQPKTYLSIRKVMSLLSIADKYIETDVDFSSAGIIARKALENMDNISQEKFPEDLLKVPKASAIYDNLYVFIPKKGNGNWEEIQKWFNLNF